MGTLSVLVLAVTAAAPANDAFRFDGPSASAWVEGGVAEIRTGSEVLSGKGSAFLRGEDRVQGPGMIYGDAGELWLRATAGPDVYRVELDAVGFPPDEALPRSRQSWWIRSPERPPRPEQPLEGGVVLGSVAEGNPALTLRGIGRVYRNDAMLAPRARIQVEAVATGLDVSVDNLPDGGALRFALKGLTFAPQQQAAAPGVGGSGAPATQQQAAAPGAGGSGAPATQQQAAASGAGGSGAPAPQGRAQAQDQARAPAQAQGSRPLMTIDEQWESGMEMLAWRDEAPAAAPGPAPGAPGAAATAPAPGQPGAPQAAAAGPAPAQAPGQAPAPAPAYGPSVPAGTQTVAQAPPPLMAVPPTPNTAPIQYETGQNGPNIGTGLIGGLGYPAGAAVPGTGIFAQGVPAPSGVFAAGVTPSAPITGTPGAPVTGTPGAPAFSSPSFSAVAGTPGLASPGATTSSSGATAPSIGVAQSPLGAAGARPFASPGIPASPPVLNNGALPPGLGISPGPLLTPQPLNAQPALTPGTTAVTGASGSANR